MSHIIALQGAGNTGKSSTLLLLTDEIKRRYPAAVASVVHPGSADQCVIFSGVKGKKVGVETQGDPCSRLQQSLRRLVIANCDVVFCSCRTRGMTVQWVNSYAAQHVVQFVPKTIASGRFAQVNATQAANLLQLAGL